MYLSLLYMCILYNYNGEEEKEAYDYLKKNWDKKYSRDRIVKKGRITLIHWFIRLGLARQALGVKKYLRSILKKNNRVQEN